jgi:hypothetical protein
MSADAKTVLVGYAVGLPVAVLVWWPLLKYSWHYWFG